MEKQELVNAIAAVLCRQKHFAIIKGNHVADKMAEDIVKELATFAEDAHIIAGEENGEVQVVPLHWLHNAPKTFGDSPTLKYLEGFK